MYIILILLYYILVISPKFRKCNNHRAIGVLIITSFWNSGLVAANAIALFTINSLGWRFYTCFVALPILIPVLALPFLAESPKYLDRINDVEQMRISLRYYVYNYHFIY